MKRLECLDGLRGVLAVYVLLGHMAPFAILPGWLQQAVSHGAAAVHLFFALSGLVIVQSLDRVGGRAAPFLLARAGRIFPVYLPVLAFAIAVEPLSCGFQAMPWLNWTSPAHSICVSGWPSTWLAEIAAHLTMTHGLFPEAILPDVWVSFLGSAWSLSAEWQFYLLAVLVPRRWLLAALLALAAGGTAWRLCGIAEWQFSRAFLPNQAHYFALGVASVGLVRRQAKAGVAYALVLLAALAVTASLGVVEKMLPPLVWTGFLLVQVAPFTRSMRIGHRLLASPACLWLGALSYCIYLVNEPIHKVIGALFAAAAQGDGGTFTLLWVPGSIALPIIAAAALNAWLERPALRWVRRSVDRRFPAEDGGCAQLSS
ncbi:MAG TPA: acyltransferase [Rhodopila sp.]|uniref:acyltransferase family protein n=1 Tax=Rhodopila sp. TaxID=2480087 RepID=UPI002C11F22D|nr:acyltransferase [Rhodopila sp.]HVY17857.1 acyltransferase [Rhodopila sp.]